MRALLFAAAVATSTSLCAQSDAQVKSPSPPRPKIGVVLSGGGARGISHVGVLRVLEELRVPVDFVAGTSMGAIVGGLFSSGKSAADMTEILSTVDWPRMLTDTPPTNDLTLRGKDEAQRYPIPLELGIRDWEIQLFKGAISGSNLELFLHQLTRADDNLANFDLLPIPFRAVATDMVTGDEIIFDRGPLYVAMRASMSVPGLFDPFEVNGRLLGDGGIVNNLPIDVVKAMGADIVIAVNIGTPLKTREQLTSILGLTSQSLNILTTQNVRTSLKQLTPRDILISPSLDNLTFMDFAKARDFVQLGEAAARLHTDELRRYALSPEAYAQYRAGWNRVYPAPDPIIASVDISGTQRANPEVLAAQMQTQPGERLDIRRLDADIARMYGTDVFERVDYYLTEKNKEYALDIRVEEKSWGPNILRFGVDLSSDFQGNAYFNFSAGVKRDWVNSLGGQWVAGVEVGRTRRLSTQFYQPLDVKQRFFASVYGEIQREPGYLFDGDRRIAEYDQLSVVGGVDAGINFSNVAALSLGLQYAHYRSDPIVSPTSFQVATADESGPLLLFRYNTLSDPFFPRSGTAVDALLFRALPALGSDTSVTRGEVNLTQAWSPTDYDTLTGTLRAGGINRRDLTRVTDFQLGGFLRLSGLQIDQLNGDYIGFGRLVYKHWMGRLPVIGRAWYLGGSLEAGNVWATRDAISSSDVRGAGSLFFAADTYLGPFYAAWGHTSTGQSTWYIFLGKP